MPLSRSGARLADARRLASARYENIASRYTSTDVTVTYRRRLTGCAWVKGRRIAAPRALHVYLHEIAHVVLGHMHEKSEHVQEYEAELWAFEVMRAEGVSIPEKSLRRARDYVAYLVHQAYCTGLAVDENALRFSGYLSLPPELRGQAESASAA